MRKNTLTKLICGIALLTFFASCKAKKELLPASLIPKVMAEEPKSDLAKIAKINAIKQMNTVFNTLSIKATANLNIDNKNNEVNMNIRIRNKEVIWVSVTAIAGLEVARAYITPDSVKILNRLDNIYIQKPFSYIYEFTNERINFQTLQSILVGNAMYEFISEDTAVNLEGENTLLESVLTSMIYNFKVDSKNKVLVNQLNDSEAGQELLVNYSNFMTINDQLIPLTVSMNSKAKNKAISLDLNYSKVDMDTKFELPFRVPERFSIKN
jgi:hypothetical protein